MFNGLSRFVRFAGPPDTTEGNAPFVRRFEKFGTSHVYIRAPGGAASAQAGAVLANAIAARLPR